MARKRIARRISKTMRAEILATAKSKGLTAAQVEKKFKVSRWTYYGWRKRSNKVGTGLVRRGRPIGTTRGPGTGSIQAEIRAALPTILREELARALATLVGGGTATRRRRSRRS